MITFEEVHINKSYGNKVNNIYFVSKNERCKVMNALEEMENNVRDEIIVLISNMATIQDFKSPKIRYNMKKYNYGEIKPKGHRVFFFKKCGNNIIFFDYYSKKKDSLGDKIYKKIGKEKDNYEKEFEKFIK